MVDAHTIDTRPKYAEHMDALIGLALLGIGAIAVINQHRIWQKLEELVALVDDAQKVRAVGDEIEADFSHVENEEE